MQFQLFGQYIRNAHTQSYTNKAIVVFLLFCNIEDAFPIVHFSRNEINPNDFSYSLALSLSLRKYLLFGVFRNGEYTKLLSTKVEQTSDAFFFHFFFLFAPELRVFLFEAKALKQFQTRRNINTKRKKAKWNSCLMQSRSFFVCWDRHYK